MAVPGSSSVGEAVASGLGAVGSGNSGWRRPFCPSALGVSVQDEAISAIAIRYLFHRAGAHRAARTVVDPVSPGFGPAANRVSLIVTHSYRHVSAITRCRYPHLLQPDDGNRRGRGSYGVVCDGQRNRRATAPAKGKRVTAHSRWRRHGSRKARPNSSRFVGENGSSDCELSCKPRSIVDGKDVSGFAMIDEALNFDEEQKLPISVHVTRRWWDSRQPSLARSSPNPQPPQHPLPPESSKRARPTSSPEYTPMNFLRP